MRKYKKTTPVCRCAVCLRTPAEIPEYRDEFKDEKYDSAEAYCKDIEGTYNPNTNLFLCTSCYIKVGMPTGRAVNAYTGEAL